MPTPEGQRLTTAYRRRQAALAAGIAALVARVWRRSTASTTAARIEGWLATVVPQILEARARAARNAASYYTAYREAETGHTVTVETPQDGPEVERMVRASLMVTGPVAAEQRLDKAEADHEVSTAERDKIYADAAADAGASAARHVRNSGRDVVADATTSDDLAVGWFRVTRPGCCYFCAMLASRGPVYKSDSFAASDPRFTGPGDMKCHDNCACVGVPWYSRDDPWPGQAEAFSELWAETGANYSGKRAVLAFRRAYEGRA